MNDIKELMQTLKSAALRAKTASKEYADVRITIQALKVAIEEYEGLLKPDNILSLIEALEAKDATIAELENDDVHQRLANAEHQLYTAELAKNNLRASRRAQFKKRREAERRAAELQSRAQAAESNSRVVTLPERYDVEMCPIPAPDGEWYHRDDILKTLDAAGIQIQGEE